MDGSQGFHCRPFEGKDEEQVELLVKEAFSDFLGGDYWNWKYKLNPSFDPSLVMVAEGDGKIIGCNHWLLRDFRLSPSLKIPAVLGADIAVNPAYRGKGVGKCLLLALRSSKITKARSPALIYMFAEANLANHLYTPAGGYVPAPDKTATYMKILRWTKVKESAKIVTADIKSGKIGRGLPKAELRVLFEISDAPALLLRIGEKGVEAEERARFERRADVVVFSDMATLQKMNSRKRRKRNLMKSVLTGKLGIRGRPRKLLVFYRSLWVLERIFSRKII